MLSRARAGTQRRAAHARALALTYTQHTTTHSARWCNVLPSLCGRCLPGHSRDDVPPGLGVTAWISAGWTRARRWQRCCGAAPLPVAPLDPLQPHPHTDPKGDLSPSPSPQPRRRLNRAGRARTSARLGAASFCAVGVHLGRAARAAAAGVQPPRAFRCAPTSCPYAPSTFAKGGAALGTVAPRSRTSRLAPHALITPHIHPHRPYALSSPVVCPWEPP